MLALARNKKVSEIILRRPTGEGNSLRNGVRRESVVTGACEASSGLDVLRRIAERWTNTSDRVQWGRSVQRRWRLPGDIHGSRGDASR